MTVTWARVAVAAVGILVWSYGARVDDATIRLAGIALLIVALLLRFVPRRPPTS
jgi:hypothetical protein